MSAKKRTCTKCEATKPETDFYKNGKGRKSYCKSCDNKARSKRPTSQLSPEAYGRKQEWFRKNAAKQKRERKAGINTAKYIYWDSRRDDRRKGFENDLTKPFIQEQIEKGCSYCGEQNLRMTLDRIDNSRGHTKNNVVPACLRCNYVRGNMPYEAWVVVARGMKQATEQGLFGNWTGRCR